jgi:UDP-N-acetylglucosamine 2-epimerase
MLTKIEEVLVEERPRLVVVFGDTNTTLAGALAAAKLHVPVAHVEAGLRSSNRAMPEEINRIAADRISDLLFCPTLTAVRHLKREGIEQGVYCTGDVMYDAVLANAPVAARHSRILQRMGLERGSYYLATVHRAQNTDESLRLFSIVEAFQTLDLPVVFSLHPRTREALGERIADFQAGGRLSNVRLAEPVSYLDMLMLVAGARKVLTDSGGLQKEAYFLGVPSVVLRGETEWVELVDSGASVLVGADKEAIVQAAAQEGGLWDQEGLFGDGTAAEQMAERIDEFLGACR